MIEYIEANEPFNTEYPTWIIAFCPDTTSFFVTNQRYFFWEHNKEFETKADGIKYFEDNINEFVGVHNRIMSDILKHPVTQNCCFLENTEKTYYVTEKPKGAIKPIEYPDSERGFLRHSECKSNIIGKDNDKMATIFCYDSF